MRLQDPAPATIVDRRGWDDYVGRYDLSPSVSFTVTREGDRLYGQRTGRPKQELLPETDTVFFNAGAPRTRKIFVRDAAGKVVRIDIDKDLIGYRPEKGKRDKHGQTIEDRVYNQRAAPDDPWPAEGGAARHHHAARPHRRRPL